MKILVECVEGIGDNLYARPFVKLLAIEHEVYVRTVLPFIYGDLDVRFVDPGQARYRTQRKAQVVDRVYSPLPVVDRTIAMAYTGDSIKRHTIVQHMERQFGFEVGSTQPSFTMPNNLTPHKLKLTGKPLAVIRPVTTRSEWPCESRAPEPNYIGWCSRQLMNAGYEVVSIADTVDGVEWIEGVAPPAHIQLHKGELTIEQTFNLIDEAKVLIGGSGFIIPAGISSKTANLFTIFGGRGAYDSPATVFDLRMDMKRIGWVLPDNFCRCTQMGHECDKTISQLDDKFYTFMSRL